MKKPSRFLRMILASGLLISLLAVTIAPAAAQDGPVPNPPNNPSYVFQDGANPYEGAGFNTIFYPWVSNGEDFGLGESQTKVTVQNLEARDGQVWIYRGAGDNNWVLAQTGALSAWASKTWTAGQLGIAEGSGAPVAIVGFAWTEVEASPAPWSGATPVYGTFTETPIILTNPVSGEDQGDFCVANNATGNPSPFIWQGNTANLDDAGLEWETLNGAHWVLGVAGNPVTPWTQFHLQAALNAANVGLTQLVNPFAGLNVDGDCGDVRTYSRAGNDYFDPLTIGGTTIATATEGSDEAELEQLVTTHTATSGYNAINGLEVAHHDQWYLPIVQTNGGPGGTWNSIIRVANLQDHNSEVTVRFFAADNATGSLQTGFQLQKLIDGGETWNINLSEWVPQGWIGAAHIYSDGGVFAMVDRYKVGYNMWITNTGSNANFEEDAQSVFARTGGKYALYAPHVLVDWFGWNTGINIANLTLADNNVSVQYLNLFGNSTQAKTQRIAPHGMTYFYDPSDSPQNWSGQNPTTDLNHGVVAAALILSDGPVAAVVDATKYPESDPRQGADVFQAISYNATQNLHTWQAFPYVTKGNAIDGSGATSGVNFLNPNNHNVFVDVYWVNPSGFGAVNFGITTVNVGPWSAGFVYTLAEHNMPNGFSGSVFVHTQDGESPIVAASANVNYDVDGDGSVIYNGFNPCGFSRVNNDDVDYDTRFRDMCFLFPVPQTVSPQ